MSIDVGHEQTDFSNGSIFAPYTSHSEEGEKEEGDMACWQKS